MLACLGCAWEKKAQLMLMACLAVPVKNPAQLMLMMLACLAHPCDKTKPS